MLLVMRPVKMARAAGSGVACARTRCPAAAAHRVAANMVLLRTDIRTGDPRAEESSYILG
jgi:hypothetical protein